jgi:Magnesium transporter NIPA
LVWLVESEMPLSTPNLQAISMSYTDIGVLVRLELCHYENGTHSLPLLYICGLLKGRDQFLFEYRTSHRLQHIMEDWFLMYYWSRASHKQLSTMASMAMVTNTCEVPFGGVECLHVSKHTGWWSTRVDSGWYYESVISGELMNSIAYAFAPAVLVTPLGALSVLIGYDWLGYKR